MKKEQLLNYFGSLVFVSFILLFLFSLVFISRFALEDSSVLQNYVESTKTLLDEIDEVQKEVENNNFTGTRIDLKNIEVFDSTYGIVDSSYLNIGDTGSFFTLKFEYPIIEFENYLVLDVDNTFNFSKGQRIIYLLSEGIVVEDNVELLEIYNLNTARISTISKSDVMGVVIYETSK